MDDAGSFLEAYFTPIKDLLKDSEIVEIAINSDGNVWIEKQGAPYMALHSSHKFEKIDANNIGTAIASDIGAQFSVAKPVLSGKIEYAGRHRVDEALGAALIGAVRRYETTKAMPFEKGIVLPGTITGIGHKVLP